MFYWCFKKIKKKLTVIFVEKILMVFSPDETRTKVCSLIVSMIWQIFKKSCKIECQAKFFYFIKANNLRDFHEKSSIVYRWKECYQHKIFKNDRDIRENSILKN